MFHCRYQITLKVFSSLETRLFSSTSSFGSMEVSHALRSGCSIAVIWSLNKKCPTGKVVLGWRYGSDLFIFRPRITIQLKAWSS